MSCQNALQCGCKNAAKGTSNGSLQKSVAGVNSVTDYDWQMGKCCVRQRLQHIFSNGCFYDVVLVVGQNSHTQRIPAHKVLLSAGSKFFETMFSEKWAPNSNEFPMPDDDPVALSALIRFLYTDDIHLTPDTVMAVWYAAKKYSVPVLENECLDFFMKNLCLENVFTILNHANLFNEPKLTEMCLKVIQSEPLRAVHTEGFTSIDFNTLCTFLKQDSLGIKEFDLFQATIRWAKAECLRKKLRITPENQRRVLKKALYLIRFPAMSMEEFSSNEVVKLGLLSAEEALSVFLFLSSKDPTGYFIDSPRSAPFLVANRLPNIADSVCSCKGYEDRIIFRVLNYDTHLVGVGLYGSPQGAAKYDVTVSILNNYDVSIFHQSQRCNYYPSSSKIFRILFYHPIKLNQTHRYQIIVKIKGPDSFFGNEGLKNVSMTLPDSRNQTINVAFSSTEAPTFHTNAWGGQIPELLFKL